MAQFRINYLTTASTGYVIEAEDEDDAIAKAEKHDMEVGLPSLCAHCSGWGQGPGIDLGDWEPDSEYPVERVDD